MVFFQLSESTTYQAYTFVAAILIIAILRLSLTTFEIKGLKGIPGWPVLGSLLALRFADSFSDCFQTWALLLGPIYQVRLGNRTVVVANSYKGIAELWIKNQASLISRPTLYTFHQLISSSENFTIGTSPWDDSCKGRRKAANMVLNTSAVQSYVPSISEETDSSIKDILDHARKDFKFRPKFFFKKFVLNVSLTLSFGTRIPSIRDAILKEIVDVEEALTRYRSHTHNLQDYLPFLRMFSFSTTSVEMYKERRNKYMADLMQELRSDIRNDVDIPCSMGKILRDETARFNESRHALTTGSLQATYTNCSAELRSLSITLLSAGLDTIPANLVQGLAILSSEIGQDIQQKIYDAIIDTYGSTEGAWDALAKEETVSYLKSFVQEVLRYFSVVPMGFPRTNNDPITIGDARIPTGTWFYMNVKSANFDPLHYSEPNVFNPERFLTAGKSGDGPQAGHYSYGAGRRACIGFHLANRLMYVMFGRMVLAWFIIAVELVDTNPSTYNLCKTSLVAEPKDFECSLNPRPTAASKFLNM